MEVRTRFAPSPTGDLHIGGVRTALYCYALARNQGGKFVLRIEDTDQKRLVPGSIDTIFEMLTAYGIEPDESIHHGGDLGPYIQSERLETYKLYADQLVDTGVAYYCFMNDEEVATQKEIDKADSKPFRSRDREMEVSEAREKAKTQPYVIRQKMPVDRVIEFEDKLQGHMKFNTNDVDDGVLLKSDGFPTYHLAVVVDDHLMQITHVFRGVEWISSTPKHVLLYEAFGWEMPDFYHLAVILDPAGGKLSKRKGAVSAEEFLREGYLPEAVLNQLMLLGWASPLVAKHGETERELFSLEEFVELFDPADLNKSNAVFNRDKMLWFNKQYISHLSGKDLAQKFISWFDKNDSKGLLHRVGEDEKLAMIMDLVKERNSTLREIAEAIEFFYAAPENIDWEIKQTKDLQNILEEVLAEVGKLFSGFDDNSSEWKHEEWEMGMRAIADKYEIKHGDAFMLLRMAVVGAPVSPPLFECLQILGKQEVIDRISKLASLPE